MIEEYFLSLSVFEFIMLWYGGGIPHAPHPAMGPPDRNTATMKWRSKGAQGCQRHLFSPFWRCAALRENRDVMRMSCVFRAVHVGAGVKNRCQRVSETPSFFAFCVVPCRWGTVMSCVRVLCGCGAMASSGYWGLWGFRPHTPIKKIWNMQESINKKIKP